MMRLARILLETDRLLRASFFTIFSMELSLQSSGSFSPPTLLPSVANEIVLQTRALP